MCIRRILAILLVLAAGLQTAAANHNALLPFAPDAFIVADSPNFGSLGPSTALDRLSPSAANGHGHATDTQHSARVAQSDPAIPPSVALRLALSYSPGSQPLDVTLVQRPRLMYAVKLKTGTRVHRVLVDARTGEIVGE
jgi:hypothetical protein